MNKHFLLLISVFGLMFTGFIIWITASPILVIETFHYSPMAFGWIQAVIFVIYIIGNRWVKYLLDWYGSNKLIHIGLSITLCGGLLGLLLAFIFPKALFPFLIGMSLYSFGAALCFAPLNRTIIELSTEPMGVRVSLFTVIWSLYIVLGSLVSALFLTDNVISIALPIAVAISLGCFLKFLT